MAINVRDVLRTEVLPTLLQAGVDLHIFTAAAEDAAFVEEFADERITLHALRAPGGGVFRAIDAVVLKLYVLVLSLRCETAHIMVHTTLQRNPAVRVARWLLRMFGRAGQTVLIRMARGTVLRLAPDLYGDVFRALTPDLVVGTRVLTMSAQTGVQAGPYLDRYLVMSAAKHNVPAMLLVSSWDNLTSKGFLPAPVTRITVWNRIMADEAMKLHDLTREQVTVTGAPQHDVYANAPYRSRERFFRGLDLEPDRKLVLYTTQTEGTIPDEPKLVEQIYERLRVTHPDAQLLVRLHQLDQPERYAFLEGRSLLRLDTAGHRVVGGYRDRDFDHAESKRLADTLAHADVVLNAASSISIDAAAVDTPIVGIAFDATPDVPYHRSLKRYFDFTHQQNVVRSGGVRLVGNLDEMVDAVSAYLVDPTLDHEGRARLVDRLCHRLDGRSAYRVAVAILAEVGVSVPGPEAALVGRPV